METHLHFLPTPFWHLPLHRSQPVLVTPDGIPTKNLYQPPCARLPHLSPHTIYPEQVAVGAHSSCRPRALPSLLANPHTAGPARPR